MATSKPDSLLRDLLAVDRTVLANERTLLAYGRTLLALLAAAATIGHFIERWWAVPASLALAASGLGLFAVGLRRFRTVNQHLSRARLELGPYGSSGHSGTESR